MTDRPTPAELESMLADNLREKIGIPVFTGTPRHMAGPMSTVEGLDALAAPGDHHVPSTPLRQSFRAPSGYLMRHLLPDGYEEVRLLDARGETARISRRATRAAPWVEVQQEDEGSAAPVDHS
jgi:hypothetical protein